MMKKMKKMKRTWMMRATRLSEFHPAISLTAALIVTANNLDRLMYLGSN